MQFRICEFQRSPRIQAASNNDPPIENGEAGKAVASVQLALAQMLGYHYLENSIGFDGVPDGEFGQETESAVRALQEIYGFAQTDEFNNVTRKPLKIDGVVGRETLTCIDDNLQTLAGMLPELADAVVHAPSFIPNVPVFDDDPEE